MFRRTIAFCAVLVLAGMTSASARVPEVASYDVVKKWNISPGLAAYRMVGKDPRRVIHVAHLSSDKFELRTVLSNNRVAGDGPLLERTSSMCIRAGCLVGVNGDFYGSSTGAPHGGMFVDGSVVRSPNNKHHQLFVTDSGALEAGSMKWSGILQSTDLKRLSVAGVNVERKPESILLYTPVYGATTGTNNYGAELTVQVLQPKGPVRLNQTMVLRMKSFVYGKGNTPLRPGELVLSGHGKGAGALRSIWEKHRRGTLGSDLLMLLESEDGFTESIGGTPILLRDGKVWFANENTAHNRLTHPRTLVAWNDKGEKWLVTVDGRDRSWSTGMSLLDAANFLLKLGASDAISLDGGGSTTFVLKGEVVNRPSDVVNGRHVERPVANALVVIPAGSNKPPPAIDLSALDLPDTVNGPIRETLDPGSVPNGYLPAYVTERKRPFWLIILAALLLLGNSVALARRPLPKRALVALASWCPPI